MIGTYLCVYVYLLQFFFTVRLNIHKKNDDTLILEQVQKKNYVLTMEDEQTNE